MSLDQDAARVLKTLADSGAPAYDTLTVAEVREMSRQGAPARNIASSIEIVDSEIPVPKGGMGIRIYRPRSPAEAGPMPGVVYFHGGGWAVGTLDGWDNICGVIAETAQCAVISVDYPLAPESKFPGPVNAAFAAYSWIFDNAATLGLDAQRLAIGGDSAGGSMAAVTALMVRQSIERRPQALLMFYPSTDLSFGTRSFELFEDGHLLTLRDMIWFRGHYLRDKADIADWRASPLKAPSLQGMPPTFMITAGYDVLRDEGEAFANRLVAEGIRVTLHRFPGQIHGFMRWGHVISEAAAALGEAGWFLRATFHDGGSK